MFRCPHCECRCISLLRKFFSSRGNPLRCTECAALSAPAMVVHYQFVVGVAYLALSSNLSAGIALRPADLVALALILSIKAFAPLRRIGGP